MGQAMVRLDLERGVWHRGAMGRGRTRTRRPEARWLLWALLLPLARCAPEASAPPPGRAPGAATGDGGGPANSDASGLDASGLDASRLDAGPPDGGLDDAGPVGPCPPQPPFGTAVGQTFPDLRLPDCAGQERSLHAACDRRASYLFVYDHW